MSKLVWVSVPGGEYQARIGAVSINLRPEPDGRVTLVDSKEGQYYRRERAVLMGPMENAMRVTEGRYLV